MGLLARRDDPRSQEARRAQGCTDFLPGGACAGIQPTVAGSLTRLSNKRISPMNQKEKAEHFAKLHVKGKPLVLYNAWDAGSAKAILDSGAKAIATSSWSVAEAQGYRDGESIPLPLVEQIIMRVAATVELPVTVDFEGGYSEAEGGLASNIGRLLDLGIIGINFEDRVVNGKGLYTVDQQARRIAALRKAADEKRVPLFINARTDVFFQEGDPKQYIDEALERAKAYA